jgi:hypothetical protein
MRSLNKQGLQPEGPQICGQDEAQDEPSGVEALQAAAKGARKGRCKLCAVP